MQIITALIQATESAAFQVLAFMVATAALATAGVIVLAVAIYRNVRLHFAHDPWRFDPRYPDAWRGATTLATRIRNTGIRIRWIYAKRENDWMRVDTAARYIIAPRRARWFELKGYGCGHHHLKIGQLCVSRLALRPYELNTWWR